MLPYKVVLWGGLSILTYVYVVGELSHFLLGIVSRPMAQDIHYGDKACLPNPEVKLQSRDCKDIKNDTACELFSDFDFIQLCVWDYSGLGIDYQILAGPAFVAVFTAAGVFIGFLADRVNRKVVVTVCCGILTLSTGLMGAAVSYWQLVLLRMLMGAGESAFSPVCSSMISDMFPVSQRAMAIGIFNWGIYFGYGLSYAVGNFITQANISGLGWRWSYILTGLLGVLATILLLFVPEPLRNSQLGDKYTENHLENAETCREDCQSPTLSEEGSPDNLGSPAKSESRVGLWSGESGMKRVLKSLSALPMVIIICAAGIRHTAGFSWAYNTQLYFLTYYPDFNLGLWVTGCSIIGGSLGVAVGGFVSDRLVKRLGIRARLYVLAGSQLLATPFAAGVLYFPPPGAFFSLLGAYLFAEMWFGVLFAVILEIVPSTVQSSAIAVFLFIMNNIGGNLPVLVDPIARALDYRSALLIMYPGGYLVSSVIFFLASFFV
ncbi:hexuronate transporter [Palaemon carinicauda]|uniref:hexuronate transporter n=1 Tax=Palaemon carinicauda TaxID=392227 RepID=UPI0035B611DC